MVTERRRPEVDKKRSKDLPGGRCLHVLIAIAYGKGVTLTVPHAHMNGCFFTQFVRATSI